MKDCEILDRKRVYVMFWKVSRNDMNDKRSKFSVYLV